MNPDSNYLAGLDESGKGDLFGTPACACVIADSDTLDLLRKVGVRDCKQIEETDELYELHTIIRANAVVVVKQVRPTEYNQLMAKPGANLNKLLAWQHAHALHTAYQRQAASRATLDQFAPAGSLSPYLQNLDFPSDCCPLTERHRAETATEVAAASICARVAFLRQLAGLSTRIGYHLRRGCSLEAQDQARILYQRIGHEGLSRIAKLHFKCCRKILRSQQISKPARTNNV